MNETASDKSNLSLFLLRYLFLLAFLCYVLTVKSIALSISISPTLSSTLLLLQMMSSAWITPATPLSTTTAAATAASAATRRSQRWLGSNAHAHTHSLSLQHRHSPPSAPPLRPRRPAMIPTHSSVTKHMNESSFDPMDGDNVQTIKYAIHM